MSTWSLRRRLAMTAVAKKAPPKSRTTRRKATRSTARAVSAAVISKAIPKAASKRKRAQAERIIAPKASAKTETLNIRIDAQTRDLVDRAASASGQNRTDFMLTVLRERSVEVLLSRRLFLVSDSDWDAFIARLDDPPPANSKLRALLAREPLWDA